MSKVIAWVLANGATVLGLVQAIIKALKELATGIVNLLSLVIPNSKVPEIVGKVRGVFNTIDEVIEKIKGYLIK